MKKEKCKKEVWNRWNYFQCSRNAVKDGYCWQHHPDEVIKRERLYDEKFQRKLDNNPYKKLKKAKERIKELEEEIGILKSQLAICSYDSKKHKSYVKERKRQINRGAIK